LRFGSVVSAPLATARAAQLDIAVGGFVRPRSYFLSVSVLLRSFARVGGLEVDVLVEHRNLLFTGPTGSATAQLREALAQAVGAICNDYMRERDARATRKKPDGKTKE
jgi:hypothetical protein